MHPFENADLKGFGLSGYRSFGDQGFLIDEIKKINVVIGKNNCGKSNVLRALHLLRSINREKGVTNLDALTDHHRRDAEAPKATIDVSIDIGLLGMDAKLRDSLRQKVGSKVRFQWKCRTGEMVGPNPFAAANFDDLNLLMSYLLGKRFTSVVPSEEFMKELIPALFRNCLRALSVFDRLIDIPNFREIRKSDREVGVNVVNGHNIIARLRTMQHPPVGGEKDRETFDKIRQFSAELLGVDRVEMEIHPTEDEIIITMNGVRSRLESYGTGVHQLLILCSALAIHNEHVVSIEEPEIHLHPELQRKFLRFISEQTNNTYFIATHSNVFLDFVPTISVYHVRYDGKVSTMQRVDTSLKARDVLADMGYKASDLLQSNCVIWVEGPSDRVFLNKWLNLVAPELTENIHYAITFYGGAVLAHFSGEDDPIDDLVEVLRINRHAAFLIDRDGDSEAAELRKYKTRIQEEIGETNCWITRGREIENYLSDALLNRFLNSRTKDKKVSIALSENDHIGAVIINGLTAAGAKATFDYTRDKVGYAREIIDHMTADDLNVLDLHSRLAALVAQIKVWNHLT